jgi:hypothetical protein
MATPVPADRRVPTMVAKWLLPHPPIAGNKVA